MGLAVGRILKSYSRDSRYRLKFKQHCLYNPCIEVPPTLEFMIAANTAAHVCSCEEAVYFYDI